MGESAFTPRMPRTASRVSLAVVTMLLAWLPRGAFGQDVVVRDASTAADPVTGASPELRVAVAGSEPFVVMREGAIEGLAVDVWRAAAQRANLRFQLTRVENVRRGIDLVAAGQYDILIGPVSITAERAERVRFTLPYFQSSLSIIARAESTPGWKRFAAAFMSKTFLAAIGVLFLVLSIVGVLIWLAERRQNHAQFPRGAVRGIGNGIWLALVTMTTVGYGDRAPLSPAGRVITGVWMVIALITASSLTAGIASALTVSQLSSSSIENAEQLANRRVAVVRGTPAVRLARRYRARTIEVPDFPAAMQRLTAGGADAVVFDRPMLLYYLQRHPDSGFTVPASRYVPQGYGFALPPDTAWLHRLNIALLYLEEGGQVRQVATDWLGRTDE